MAVRHVSSPYGWPSQTQGCVDYQVAPHSSTLPVLSFFPLSLSTTLSLSLHDCADTLGVFLLKQLLLSLLIGCYGYTSRPATAAIPQTCLRHPMLLLFPGARASTLPPPGTRSTHPRPRVLPRPARPAMLLIPATTSLPRLRTASPMALTAAPLRRRRPTARSRRAA